MQYIKWVFLAVFKKLYRHVRILGVIYGNILFMDAGITAFVIYNVVSSRNARRKFRQRLVAGFGQAPTSFDSDIWGSVIDY